MGVFILFNSHNTYQPHKKTTAMETKRKCLLGLFGALLIFAIVLIASSAKRVKSGHVGVLKRYGKVNLEKPLEEGLNWVAPFVHSVEQISTRVQAVSHTSLASSKDLQTVTTDITCQYYVVNQFAPQLFQKLGTLSSFENTVVQPAIQESMKAVTARYTAEELITKRDVVKAQIHTEIAEFIDITLDSKGMKGALVVANVAITDFQFSEEFNKAIELKVKAEQEALQAENEKIKKITMAEAEAEQQRLAADANAYQFLKEAEARASAINLEGQALNNHSGLIQLRIAEKWDGKVSQVKGVDGGVLLDVQGLTNSGKK